MYEKKITELIKQLEIEHARSEGAEEQVDIMKKLISDNQKSIEVFTLYSILEWFLCSFLYLLASCASLPSQNVYPSFTFHILTVYCVCSLP